MYDTVALQYYELNKFDAVIGLSAPEDSQDISNILKQNPSYQDSLLSLQSWVLLESGNNEVLTKLVVPSDKEKFSDFFAMSGSLTDDFVFISAKAAEILKVKAGDEIFFQKDGTRRNVFVTGIFNSHVFHEIFISPNLLSCDYQTLFVKMPGFNDDTAYELFASGKVESVIITDDVVTDFIEVRRMLDVPIYIIAGIAVIFVIIIIYNLAVLTRVERVTEIKILEQIGYTDLDIHRYLFRELMIVATFGFAGAIVLNLSINDLLISWMDNDSLNYVRNFYSGGLAIVIVIILLILTVAYWWDYFLFRGE